MLKNPVIPGFHPDPSVCRVGQDYYLVTSSFEFFPGLPLFHSRDLVHWRQIGHALTRDSQLPLHGCRPSGGLYAPTIRYWAGVFYITCTNVTAGGNFIVRTRDVYGAWSEPVYVDQAGIDPSLFFDDDGQVYFCSTYRGAEGAGIGMSLVNPDTGERLSPCRRVWAGSGGRHPEGPHLYKINGRYYLMIAEGGTEAAHMETIAVADSPWGPYTGCPDNPILTNRDESDNPVAGTGHADLVQATDGSWWAVFLAYRYTDKYFHHLGRETFLAPVTWRGGWPYINDGKPIQEEMPCALLPFAESEAQAPVTDFSRGVLGPEWNYLRNPARERYIVDADGVTLLGGQETLCDCASPTAIFRRQCHFSAVCETRLRIADMADGARAGLTVFYQNQRHYDLYLTRDANGLWLCLTRTVDDIGDTRRVRWQGDATLRVTADALGYIFSAVDDDGAAVTLGGGSTRLLSTESAVLGFTGVFFGLFAQGDCRARFSCFNYMPEAPDTPL